jgi:glycolate oxidase iron-sulfur subunit
MQHTIPVDQLEVKFGPQVKNMADAVEACVHCGFCLSVCPTYQVQGEEMDSPRGRIILMRSVLEGQIELASARQYIDRCLGCLACATACPSGVRYGELITPFRAYARSQNHGGWMERLQDTLVEESLPYPARFRTAARLGRLAQPFKGLMPDELQNMLALLPERLTKAKPLPEMVPAQGVRRARVALLAGCVQQVLAPEINWATLRVLARNGVEVVIPQGQGCCGALLLHTGDQAHARQLARRNLRAFPKDVDVVLTNAAGCGSGMKEYPLLFKGRREEGVAGEFSAKVKDVSQFLDELGLLPTPPLPQALKAAYHDACHLANAQGIMAAPRRLLSAIPNLTLLEVPDGGLCCGSAGTYNLEQPEIAAELGRRKANHILQIGSEAVVMGNIGCMVQIRTHLQALGKLLPIFHTFELLDMAYATTG